MGSEFSLLVAGYSLLETIPQSRMQHLESSIPKFTINDLQFHLSFPRVLVSPGLFWQKKGWV